MSSKCLKSGFQLNQLNMQVWVEMARAADETELVKSNIEVTSPPTLNAVNEPEPKVSESPHDLDETAQ